MTAVCFDDGTPSRFGVLFDDVAEVFEGDAGFDHGNCLVEAFSGCLDELHELLIGERFVADVVSFVEITVIAFMVESYVEVEDVTIQQNSLIRNAVTDDFVW